MSDLYHLNSVWTMLNAILVIFMQGGSILLKAGSTRMKNAGHIIALTVLILNGAEGCDNLYFYWWSISGF